MTATSTSTGLTRTTQTNESGLYSFTGLPVSSYDLTVDSQGFKNTKRTGINLSVGAVATIDVALEIGTAQETVSVTAEVPVVETTRSQTSTTVTSKQVSDLPINGRNFLDFTVLTPGVVRDPTRSGDLSFGGRRGTSNSIRLKLTVPLQVIAVKSMMEAGPVNAVTNLCLKRPNPRHAPL